LGWAAASRQPFKEQIAVSAKHDERLMMYERGTLRWQPSAKVVFDAAVYHMGCCTLSGGIDNDRARARRVGAQAKYAGKKVKGGFLPAHARYAKTPLELLCNALKGISDGQRAPNVETRILYQSPQALEEAIGLAMRHSEDQP
jgi:hypothetical protein